MSIMLRVLQHNVEYNRPHYNTVYIVINNNKFVHEQWHIVTVVKGIIIIVHIGLLF